MTTGSAPGTIPGGALTVIHGITARGGSLSMIHGSMIPGSTTLGILTPGTEAAITGIHTGHLRSIMIRGITIIITGITAMTTMPAAPVTSAPEEILMTEAGAGTATI